MGEPFASIHRGMESVKCQRCKVPMATVTERKLIRAGRRALSITIPKAWADFYGLKPGDSVRVIADDVLTVHPPQADDASGPAK